MASSFSPRALPPVLSRKLSPPSPFLPTSLQTVDVLQQDLRGRIVPAKISNRTFEHMEIKFLVFELPLPEVRLSNEIAAEHSRRELLLTKYREWYENEVKIREQRKGDVAEKGDTADACCQPPLPPPPPPSTALHRPLLPDHPIIKGATQDYFVIPDFETLVKIHKPTNIYRVYPRKSGKIAAYCTMKEICSMGKGWSSSVSPTTPTPLAIQTQTASALTDTVHLSSSLSPLAGGGGGASSASSPPFYPFTMSDRIDPHLYRLVVKQDMAEACRQWSDSLEARALNSAVSPGTPIGWDGMFISSQDVGFVLCGQALNEKAVNNALGMTAFLRHMVPQSKKFISFNEDFACMWSDILRRRRFHYFISGDRPPTRDALGFARQKGVHFFTRYGPYYRYCY